MDFNNKFKSSLLDNITNVSIEDTFYEKLISMGDAGDFSTGKYNSMTSYVIKKKDHLLKIGYSQLLKIFK